MATQEHVVRQFEVYRIVSPDLVYVGCGWGRTGAQRFATHQRCARLMSGAAPQLEQALRDGVSFTLEILECGVGTLQESREREQHWLDTEINYGERQVLNLNLHPAIPGPNPTHPVVRQRMKDAQQVRVTSPQERARRSHAAREFANRPEAIARMKENNPVRHVTPEIRAMITKKITGKVRSPESRARYAAAARAQWARESKELTYCKCGAGPFKGPRAVKNHAVRKHKEMSDK